MLQRGIRSDQNDDVLSADSVVQREKAIEREMFSCCYCEAPLEAIMLETDEKTGEQRLLWACRNMKKNICFFPMGLPSEIFFLKRSALEKEEGVIPKPDIRRLPKKFWGLYPTVFADQLQSKSRTSDTRAETSMSNHTTDYLSCQTNSPTTSGSSVSSDHAAFDQLLKMGSETPVWGNSISKSKRGNIVGHPHSSGASSSDKGNDTNKSAVTNSTSTCSSTDANGSIGSGGALAELICDHLQYTGVDIGRLEDDELVSKMAGIVKKLHKEKPSRAKFPGNFTHAEYHASLDYLFNLDVTPIKRKLNVRSADLPRVVALMRSKCDIDTMLNAMGGSTPTAAPPAKRSKTLLSKSDLRKRVESILNSLAARRKESEKPTSGSADTTANEEDPFGAKEWYEGEDGPSTSVPIASHVDSASAEEERLNAIVKDKVRSCIAKSAARRNEHRRRRMQESSLQSVQLNQHQSSCGPPLPLHSNDLAPSEPYNEEDGLLSFDSPYADSLGDVGSALSFPHDDLIQQSHSAVVQDLSISDSTHFHSSSPNSDLDLHSPVGDDEFSNLFAGYNFM
ncbi:hypothetical protein V3C99_004403 [Haemonchus contortus]